MDEIYSFAPDFQTTICDEYCGNCIHPTTPYITNMEGAILLNHDQRGCLESRGESGSARGT
jgi:hypothetical protein